jgi:hypothetical protein
VIYDQNDRILDIVLDRLDRIETKVDALMAFRAWLLGLGAAAGAIAGWLVSWFRGHGG